MSERSRVSSSSLSRRDVLGAMANGGGGDVEDGASLVAE